MREYKILEKNGISVDGVYTKGTKCTKRPKCTKRRSIKREQTKDKEKKGFQTRFKWEIRRYIRRFGIEINPIPAGILPY